MEDLSAQQKELLMSNRTAENSVAGGEMEKHCVEVGVDDWTSDQQSILVCDRFSPRTLFSLPWFALRASKSDDSPFWWLQGSLKCSSGVNPAELFNATSLEF